jgi:hypothetical protein
VVDTMALPFGKAGVFPRAFALSYSYALKDEGERSRLGIGSAEHKLDTSDVEFFDVRIEVSAWAVPAPLEAGMERQGKGSDTFGRSLWGREHGTMRLAVVFGPSDWKRESPIGAPSDALAPVKAIKVSFQGPTAVVKALARQLDRAAFRAMLGPIEKIIKVGN